MGMNMICRVAMRVVVPSSIGVKVVVGMGSVSESPSNAPGGISQAKSYQHPCGDIASDRFETLEPADRDSQCNSQQTKQH